MNVNGEEHHVYVRFPVKLQMGRRVDTHISDYSHSSRIDSIPPGLKPLLMVTREVMANSRHTFSHSVITEGEKRIQKRR
jgi:hypothetical protein